MDNGGPSVQIVRFGTFQADLQTGELRKNGHKVPLQGQPFQVFTILVQHSGKLVTREELRQKVWPEDTFVDFDHGLNTAITKIRTALGDDADNPRFVETMPRRGYRFIAPVDSHPQPGIVPVRSSRIQWVMIAWLVSVAALAMAGYLYFHRVPKLTDKDTIVLSDFDNKTGDPVFDETLRQGLEVELQQSPFLSIISEERVRQTLRLMKQSPDARLNPEIARQICQRTGSAAVLDGSIANLGNQYVLGVKAVNCRTGDFLAEEQVAAERKEQVLKALAAAAKRLRTKLGESLNSVEKFNTPLEEATTPSLEALQAFSLGVKTIGRRGDSAAAVPFFQRAIKLDPNFALAYGHLGNCYANLGKPSLAAENTRKAYELRDRVSEREKLIIESFFYSYVTGNFEKDIKDLEVWVQTYPRDPQPRNFLGVDYFLLGQYDKAVEEGLENLRLAPEHGIEYGDLVSYYRALDRLGEARATLEETRRKGIDNSFLHVQRYFLAFLENDAAGMKQQVDWGAGKPDLEPFFLGNERDTAAYSGLLAIARVFSRQGVAYAERAEEKELAAGFESGSAVIEALFGNIAESRHRIDSALTLFSTNRDVQYNVALALALIEDAPRSQELTDDLRKRFPEDSIVQFNYLPTLQGQIALIRNDPSKAIEALQTAVPYELGPSAVLYPAYVRGEAYLAAHKGKEAAAEFQKILGHRGIVLNDPIGALAHLQIGRAYAMQDDTAKAKAAYQDFLALWKDADPDIPIFIAAKAEYAKLN
jgi:DNA-binding winged helix-turn-helix (wHTH) protein/tetratricopeptide (TPR) repeat protein